MLQLPTNWKSSRPARRSYCPNVFANRNRCDMGYIHYIYRIYRTKWVIVMLDICLARSRRAAGLSYREWWSGAKWVLCAVVVVVVVVPRTISNPSRPCQARVFRFLLLAQSVEIGAACELSSVHYEPAIQSLILRHLEESRGVARGGEEDTEKEQPPEEAGQVVVTSVVSCGVAASGSSHLILEKRKRGDIKNSPDVTCHNRGRGSSRHRWEYE